MVEQKSQTLYQVRFIVDANIVFSGILNTNGKIGDLLINSKPYFTFIAPEFLRTEIRNHHLRLVKFSGLTIEEIYEAEFHLYKDILFISQEQIKISNWVAADALVAEVDPKDTPYIAYAKQFRCKIWSGDKKLIKGLSAKGFINFITTDEIYKLRENQRDKT
ncbi:MAG: PIN domain-containing protein [Ginsengibacter sp.]